MDSQLITATTGFIGAVVALLTAIGGGIGVLIRRADKKREAGEERMLAYLKEQLRKSERKNRWLERALQIRTDDCNSFRDQLLRHDIEPEPSKLTPLPEQPEEDQ